MVQNIQKAQLIVYSDEGRAGQFQCADRFLKHAVQFLDA